MTNEGAAQGIWQIDRGEPNKAYQGRHPQRATPDARRGGARRDTKYGRRANGVMPPPNCQARRGWEEAHTSNRNGGPNKARAHPMTLLQHTRRQSRVLGIASPHLSRTCRRFTLATARHSDGFCDRNLFSRMISFAAALVTFSPAHLASIPCPVVSIPLAKTGNEISTLSPRETKKKVDS